MNPREIIGKFVSRHRARLLLQVECDLNCQNCHEVSVITCWIANIGQLAKEFPNEVAALVPNMSKYSLSRLLASFGGKLDDYLVEKEEYLRSRVLELLGKQSPTTETTGREEEVEGELVLDLSWWFSSSFRSLSVFQRMALLELLALVEKTGSSKVVNASEYLAERMNTTGIVVDEILRVLEHCGYITTDSTGIEVNKDRLGENSVRR